MEKEYISQKDSSPEHPSDESIDYIISEIEMLRGPRNLNGEAHLALDPAVMGRILLETSQQPEETQVDEAYFVATDGFDTNLVVRFENGNDLIYSLGSKMPGDNAGASAKKYDTHDQRELASQSAPLPKDMTMEDMKVLAEALNSLVETLPPLHTRLFQDAAARLIAHGDVVGMSGKREKALFDDRPPISLSYPLAIEKLPYRPSPHPEHLYNAEISFIERRTDTSASAEEEPLPDTVALTVESLDDEGHICESVYLLHRQVGTDDSEIEGGYMRLIQKTNEQEFLEDLFNEELFRDLTISDLDYLRSAIELLPDAPNMNSYNRN